MLRRSHVAIGIIAAASLTGAADELLIAPLPALLTAAPFLAGAAFGSVLPDFDLSLHIPHRGVTHWLIWPALLWFLVHNPIVHGLALGWVTHILADCLTLEGLRPLWPLPLRLAGPIKTGGALESLAVPALCGLLAWNIYSPVVKIPL